MKLLNVVAVAALCLWASMTVRAGTVTYVYTDPQGTPLAEADVNGHITDTFDYRPYGAGVLGRAISGPGYTGHVNDTDTALIYMQARYYDPMVGRFLSVDPVAVHPGIGWFNRFAYAMNNPGALSDPTGMFPEHESAADIQCEVFHCEFVYGDSGLPVDDSSGGKKNVSSSGKGTSSNTGVGSSTSDALASSLADDDGRRPLTDNEKKAANNEFPELNAAIVYIDYKSPSSTSAITPGNTIHFPKNMSGCRDFTTCSEGDKVGWFIHETTHAWQHQQHWWSALRKVGVWGAGPYLNLQRYKQIKDPSHLNFEEQADWHMWNYICRNKLAGC